MVIKIQDLSVAQHIIDRDYTGFVVIECYHDNSLGIIIHCNKNESLGLLEKLAQNLPTNKKILTFDLPSESNMKIVRIAPSDYMKTQRELRINQIINAS